jgi:very-short-patch-repair endonuclease
MPVPSAELAAVFGSRGRIGGDRSGQVKNWQPFVPAADGSGEQADLSAALPTVSEERARTLSLIDFLADYDARRNPPVYDIGRYDLFLLRDADLPAVPGVNLTPAAAAWLTVDFLDPPQRPAVPEELVELLGDGATISPQVRPEVRTARDGMEPDGWEPAPELVAAAEQWIAEVWEPFATRAAEVIAAKALHRELFQQRERLATDRESVELVWGFGRLRWLHDGELIDHPLITIPVEVEQEEVSQRIRVCPAGAPEVEARCLAGLLLADRTGFMSIRQSVNDAETEPWDAQVLQGLLRSLIRAIDHDGTVVEHAPPPAEAAAAVVDGSWVLFMRRRLPDYQGFLEQMRTLYRDQSVPVPSPLQAAVADAPSALAGQVIAAGSRPGGPDERLLLPLPTNEEQQRILTQAQHSTGVTVQGPPGTGKSHTIANIISHYVAYGKRVLVVAEKEQALRALTGKIPAGIKELTVSVLGADADSRRELESAIGQIQTRVTAIDKTFADERIRQLTTDLDEADRAVAVTIQALLATREAEVERLPGTWLAGQAPTRAEAAHWVAEQSSLGYIDDLIMPVTPSPVAAGEVAEFVRLIRQVGVSRADACARDLPDLTAIPSADDLADRFAKLAQLQSSIRLLDDAVNDWGLAVACGREGLQALAARCHAEMDWVAKNAGTWLGRVQDQANDPLLAQDWWSFSSQLSRDRQEVLDLRAVLTAHRVVIPDIIEPSFIDGLQDARDRLSESGRLGLFAGPAKRAMQECRVDGRQPSTAEDIGLCLQAVALQDLRWRIQTSWQNQVARVGGTELGAGPEDVLGRVLDELDRALSWPDTWARLRADLAAAGIASPAAADANTLGNTAEVCIRACDQILFRELSRWVRGLHEWLQTGTEPAGASPLWQMLADALHRQDLTQWQRLREELSDLHDIAPAARQLRELRRRLSACTPIWASRILADPAAAGDPTDFDAAWQWRQLDTWVCEALGGKTPAQLQARLEELSRDRRRVIAELVSERAWRRLADSLGDRQRQALNAYLRAVTRFGKTGGKFAQRWLAEIRDALNESKDAIPVWIMPTARALTSFRPEAEPPFDLLVVDEASQIGMEALPLLALAQKTIVVGDDKQTSPENVGLDRQQVFDLLDEHLAVIPKYRILFDPDNSLYDIAFQKFPGVVMLTEHFRCLPPIIAFSNAHAYNNRIIPLRDQPPHPGWTALGAVKVLDVYRTGMINEPEADAIVDLAAELCANPDYNGMDMGVISLLGSTQSKLIWDKLYDRLGPEVMNRRRLRSGEPASFQGDERDVIIISTVVAVDPAIPSARIAAMTGNAAARRINVAASRARQQMWTVHSVKPSQFPDGDLRSALIRHCHDAGATTAPAADLLNACESQFERDVLQKILARGYRKVTVQHRVGHYRIDIVVEGPHARLAVECDGDRWHGPDVWHKDRARQQVLERAGWTFERIRGSAFYLAPDTALLPLWQRLTDLDIPTGDWWSAQTLQPVLREVSGPSRQPDLAHTEDEGLTASRSGTQTVKDAPSPAPITIDTAPAGPQLKTLVPGAAPAAPVESAIAASAVNAEAPSSGNDDFDGEGRIEPETPTRSDPARHRIGVALPPYRAWTPHTLPHPDVTPLPVVIAGLQEIVAAEGPIHAGRAYRLYNRAAGGHRVGKEMRQAFRAATRRALRAGDLRQLDDNFAADEKTLYVTGKPSVMVRELGPRQLWEVPRSEVAKLIKYLSLQDAADDVAKRSVLNAYGLVRLTARTSQYLDECLNYNSNRPTAP